MRSRSGAAALLASLALGGCFLGDGARVPGPETSTAATPLVPPPLPGGRLPETARPTRYTVALAIDPTRDRFSGTVTIAVDVPRPTQAIVLHGRDLSVSRAELHAGGRRHAADVGVRSAGRDAPDELVLTLAEPVPAGPAEIAVTYTGPVGNKLAGLFRVREEGTDYAFTQLEPTDARRMLPCFDEPSYRAVFELTVTTPKGNLVLANMPEIERTAADEGHRVAFRFAPTPPLPTYLFALAVGPFDVREAPPGRVPLRLVAARGKAALGEQALEVAAAQIDLLAAYFDRPFPYPKLDLVAVPELGFAAMENAALVSFREDLILLDPRATSATAQRAMTSALAHEIAHHWFGNLVTIPRWDELWLKEGFSTWIDGKINDAYRPALGARMEALRAKDAVMELDGLDSARAVRHGGDGAHADEPYDDITYDKSAAVLAMLEAWLGEEAFRAGVREHIAAHAQGSAGAADLFAALGRAGKRDVASVAAGFLDQPGVPLVRAELTCAPDAAPRVRATAERYRSRGRAKTEARWKIPVCISHEGGAADRPACRLLDASSIDIPLPLPPGRCPRWVYPNADERGYYRFALPPAGLSALIRAAKKLPAAERLGLVANSWALLQSSDVDADALLDVLDALRGERDLRVVEQIAITLSHLSAVVDDATRPAFRALVTRLLGPTARELGFAPKAGEPDERRLLRVHLLSTLADLADDAWVLGEAEKRAAAWLANPGSVSADVAPVALLAGSRRAGEKRFGELLEATRRARSPAERAAAVGALGGFSDPQILRRALDLVLTEPLKIHDGFHVFNAALARAAARPVVRAWVKERFGELRSKVPDFALGRLTSVVEGICDARALEDASSFFTGALEGTEGGDQALVRAAERSERCVDLRTREAARLAKRLGRPR